MNVNLLAAVANNEGDFHKQVLTLKIMRFYLHTSCDPKLTFTVATFLRETLKGYQIL